jgi:hypothetical protein
MTKSIRRNKTFKTKKSRKNKNKSNLKGGRDISRVSHPTVNPVQHLLLGAESCNGQNALVLNIEDINGLLLYLDSDVGNQYNIDYLKGILRSIQDSNTHNSCNTYIIDSNVFNE